MRVFITQIFLFYEQSVFWNNNKLVENNSQKFSLKLIEKFLKIKARKWQDKLKNRDRTQKNEIKHFHILFYSHF